MAKGYWIVSVEMYDAEEYKKYQQAVRPFLASKGAVFLTRGGAHEVVEGEANSRNVIIEFESYEQALAVYRSDEYQALIPLRRNGSTSNFIIVEGFDS
ncbi:MAG: DUF1330 domain-containing protein [Hyphomicrobiaceae bacterium]|nr:DUF1330 domain-containing protein [Hyphomicrobiaceae bacterium]MCC0023588.1 DUF1330 domain-containing protein [Hyphomicrobiaceae bacterium]